VGSLSYGMIYQDTQVLKWTGKSLKESESISGGSMIFVFGISMFILAQEPSRLANQWVPTAISQTVKRPEHKTDPSYQYQC
jgi:hypothetical protein